MFGNFGGGTPNAGTTGTTGTGFGACFYDPVRVCRAQTSTLFQEHLAPQTTMPVVECLGSLSLPLASARLVVAARLHLGVRGRLRSVGLEQAPLAPLPPPPTTLVGVSLASPQRARARLVEEECLVRTSLLRDLVPLQLVRFPPVLFMSGRKPRGECATEDGRPLFTMALLLPKQYLETPSHRLLATRSPGFPWQIILQLPSFHAAILIRHPLSRGTC